MLRLSITYKLEIKNSQREWYNRTKIAQCHRVVPNRNVKIVKSYPTNGLESRKRRSKGRHIPTHSEIRVVNRQNVDKSKRQQSKRRQTETSTLHFSTLYAHIYICWDVLHISVPMTA